MIKLLMYHTYTGSVYKHWNESTYCIVVEVHRVFFDFLCISFIPGSVFLHFLYFYMCTHIQHSTWVGMDSNNFLAYVLITLFTIIMNIYHIVQNFYGGRARKYRSLKFRLYYFKNKECSPV